MVEFSIIRSLAEGVLPDPERGARGGERVKKARQGEHAQVTFY